MSVQITGIRTFITSLLLLVLAVPAGKAETINITVPVTKEQPAIPSGESIPLSELGTRAGKNYSGEALSVTATEAGARLRTDFQRLQGEVTEQGLTLESTVAGQPRERFALAAVALGRGGVNAVAFPRHGKEETE
jgi:hypothetical protein